MLNCYIIDDESHALNVLAGYITKTPEVNLIGKSQDPIVALKEINSLIPDIAFIDIEMPVMNGIELSDLVKKETSVIFTTAHANFAVDAFDHGSYDFLLKPIRYERFIKSIQKVTEFRHKLAGESVNHKDHIFIQSGFKGQMIRIRLEDVSYIESMNNYIIIHVNQDKHIVYLTLKETLETLPHDLFSRIHKSLIVNDGKIKAIEGNMVIVDDNIKTKLPIGHNFKSAFLEKISKNVVKRKTNL